MSNIIFEDNFKYEDPIEKITSKHFNIPYLYPSQRFVIANILDAYSLKNTNEANIDDKESIQRQIVLLPTGAGKSLCFQVPAIILPEATLIIYPLLSLMSDQARRIKESNISFAILKGSQTQKERITEIDKIKNGAKIIITNPETLNDSKIIQLLKEIKISHIAIDEAHCVYQWGSSFRPSYLNLNKIIKELNPPVVTAFTATASPYVLEQISNLLFDKNAHIIQSDNDRPNIHYYVKKAASKKQEAILLAKTEQKPLIIFCSSRKKTEDLSKDLNLCYGSNFSRFYHAGLNKQEKENIQSWFLDNKEGVLCATCAYGMGIDKKDIRTVIHYDVPLSVESYIQEAGRGGRDGNTANAILLWNTQDKINLQKYKNNSRYRVIEKMATTKECRRQVLLDALNNEKVVCSGCDICNKKYNLKNKGLNHKLEQIDYKIALDLIKKHQRFYSKAEFIEEAEKKLNKEYKKIINLNIWNSDGINDVFLELINSKKIKYSSFLWKNKLQTTLIHKNKIIPH